MMGMTLATFKITDHSLEEMRAAGVPDEVLQKLTTIKGRKVRGQRKMVSLLQQKIGYEETATHQEVILKVAAIKRKKSGRRLKKPSLLQYIGKVAQSAILGAVVSITVFCQDWLNGVLYPKLMNPVIDFITWVKLLASAFVFVVFLMLKVLYNLGIIED